MANDRSRQPEAGASSPTVAKNHLGHPLGLTAEGKNSSGWPGGWYVYDQGKVDGPYSAAEAFRMDAETKDGKPRLVSRKGFSQWYALKDLSEIFRMTEQMGQRVAAITPPPPRPAAVPTPSVSDVQGAEVSPAPTTPRQMAEPVKAPGVLKVKGRQLDLTTTSPGKAAAVSSPAPESLAPTLDAASQVEAGRSYPLVQTRADRAFSLTVPSPLFEPSVTKNVVRGRRGKRAAEGAKATGAASQAPSKNQSMLMQEYFVARGRLRLGKLRNPWLSAFLGMPFTLGLLWAFWLRDLASEAHFHSRNVEKSPLPPAFLAIVPLVHIYMGYRLAKLIAELEAQNRYKFVSPGVAACLSIFPPFAMAYLQYAANRHWMLHARHASARRKTA